MDVIHQPADPPERQPGEGERGTDEPGGTPVDVERAVDELLESGAPHEGSFQVQLQMHELVVHGTNIRVGRHPQTGERVIIVGPLLLNIALPLTEEAAKNIGRELTGGIEIASGLPPRLQVIP